MTSLGYMLQLVVISAVIFAPLVRFRAFRKLVGFTDIRSDPRRKNADAENVDIIASAGKSRPDRVGDLLVFEGTIGFRLVTTMLIMLLLCLLFRDGIGNWVGALSALISVVGAVYWIYTAWTYRMVLDHNELHKRDWKFVHQTYDLADLRRVEYDGSGGYRLEFNDGRVAYILRYICGHALFRDFLIKALEINKR